MWEERVLYETITDSFIQTQNHVHAASFCFGLNTIRISNIGEIFKWQKLTEASDFTEA